MRIHEILTEAELDEINRRGFLKGLGAGAAGTVVGPATAKGGLIYGAPIPIHTDSDPPLKRTIKVIWNYKGDYKSLTDSDKKIITQSVYLLYLARISGENQLYKEAYKTVTEINDAFTDVDVGKVMNSVKEFLENLRVKNPNQFNSIQNAYFSKQNEILTAGNNLATQGPGAQSVIDPFASSTASKPNTTTTPPPSNKTQNISYNEKLMRAVKPHITLLDVDMPEVKKDYTNPAEVEVRTNGTGNIVYSYLGKSSGSKKWDDAVINAINKTKVLPLDEQGKSPRAMTFRFNPFDT
jgi:hypothetical protein